MIYEKKVVFLHRIRKHLRMYQPNIRKSNDKEQIFCDWRQKFVRLTPEEWVRQQFLHNLVDTFDYPKNLIAVEAPIQVGDVSKRCDAVVYNKNLQPICLIEFKKETVNLTQKVFDQVAVYNRKLNVSTLILSNGKQTIVAKFTNEGYEFLTNIPQWNQLSN